MNRALLEITSKGLRHRLLMVLLLTGMAVILSVCLGVKVMVGAALESGHEYIHEDIHLEVDGTEGAWQVLLNEPPEGLEIIPIYHPLKGEIEDYLTTGTNDFYISAWRDTDGNWQILPGGKTITAVSGKSDKELLLGELQQEWEFKMKIPAEVAEKMGEGYAVGVTVSEAVSKDDFKASTEDLN